MLERIISDVDKALDAEAYLSALALMMTIPDICAKAEYGDAIGNKERYIEWFEEYIGKYNRPPLEKDETETPYLSGEIAYQLRCSVLHEGNPDVDKAKIKDTVNQIDCFSLLIEKANPFDIYADSSSVVHDMQGNVKSRSYEVNIRRLWVQIKEVSERYYEKNKEKFGFLKFKIYDMDERIASLKKWREL